MHCILWVRPWIETQALAYWATFSGPGLGDIEKSQDQSVPSFEEFTVLILYSVVSTFMNCGRERGAERNMVLWLLNWVLKEQKLMEKGWLALQAKCTV